MLHASVFCFAFFVENVLSTYLPLLSSTKLLCFLLKHVYRRMQTAEAQLAQLNDELRRLNSNLAVRDDEVHLYLFWINIFALT